MTANPVICSVLKLKKPNSMTIGSLSQTLTIPLKRSATSVAKANNLFPAFMKVIRGDAKNLKIFGNDWPTDDGTCVRDYIHIIDLAEAHLAALQFLINSQPQLINLNIGTGKGTSVLELVNIFKKVTNFDLPYEFVKRREGDCAYVVANNDLALKVLNWYPKKDIKENSYFLMHFAWFDLHHFNF